MSRRPLPRSGEGAVWASNCLFYPQSRQRDFLRLACRNQIKNQPYKRRRVGRNLRLSRADPALCSGQPSPLRCILLSPQGLTTLRGPRLYGVYRRVGVSGSSPSDFWVLFFTEKYPPPGRRAVCHPVVTPPRRRRLPTRPPRRAVFTKPCKRLCPAEGEIKL